MSHFVNKSSWREYVARGMAEKDELLRQIEEIDKQIIYWQKIGIKRLNEETPTDE